jgi:hypothetical protein
MAAIKQLIFSILLGMLSFSVYAQNKYAVLIGINDYYEVRGVKSRESLHGSVNDANAIRRLLISRFGFKSASIDTIYNGNATRDNIIAGLKRKLDQCKPGDMMVFYYSGHGVWMKNSEEANDPVKKGMNQAMLTSDLYNYDNNFKCFLRDFTLKKYFNLFVDKRVTLTAIFDCCFSGNLAMADPELVKTHARTKSIDFNELMSRLTEKKDDPMQFIDSISGMSTTIPAGCPVDASSGVIKDNTDSDGDGVPDCKDKEKFTAKECFPVNADGVGNCPFDYLLHNTLNKYDSTELGKNNSIPQPMVSSRAFSATEVIKISEKDTIARPAERKNSGFLFISATTDYQKALEFRDQDSVVHGFFTASVIRAFNKYPANTPVDSLFSKIKADMGSFHLNQTPILYSDPARLKDNFVGTIVENRNKIKKRP